MSCCNSKVKVSDLIDLSFIDDFCKFNEQTKKFVELNRKSSDLVDCCNSDRYVVRFERLKNLKVMLTFEDTETGNVDFIETELVNESESIETLFKRLVRVNEITHDESLDLAFRNFKVGLVQTPEVPIRLQESKLAKVIYRSSIRHSTVAAIKFTVDLDTEDLPVLSRREYNRFIRTLDVPRFLPILTILTRDLNFIPYALVHKGINGQSFTISYVYHMEDDTRLLADVEYVHPEDSDWGVKLSENLLSCNK